MAAVLGGAIIRWQFQDCSSSHPNQNLPVDSLRRKRDCFFLLCTQLGSPASSVQPASPVLQHAVSFFTSIIFLLLKSTGLKWSFPGGLHYMAALRLYINRHRRWKSIETNKDRPTFFPVLIPFLYTIALRAGGQPSISIRRLYIREALIFTIWYFSS